jgi:hypothetical protein
VVREGRSWTNDEERRWTESRGGARLTVREVSGRAAPHPRPRATGSSTPIALHICGPGCGSGRCLRIRVQAMLELA